VVLDRIDDLIYGAKLLGAGGGGFLFMVTKGIAETHVLERSEGMSLAREGTESKADID